MNDWLATLTTLTAAHTPCVLVTVAATKGSTPRAAGTKMVVSGEGAWGTIGGGALEHQAIELARALLAEEAEQPLLRRFPLGPALGQCCGGVADLLLEPIRPVSFRVALFGAGHVGRALVQVLGGLPCCVTWIDSRAAEFPAELPSNVEVLVSAEPDFEVDDLPAGSYLLVMTHSHPLDQAICERALRRDDLPFCGLIGSVAKARKFRQRLQLQGIGDAALERLSCPVGLAGVGGKHPGEVAVAVAAQLLQVRQQRRPLAAALQPESIGP